MKFMFKKYHLTRTSVGVLIIFLLKLVTSAVPNPVSLEPSLQSPPFTTNDQIQDEAQNQVKQRSNYDEVKQNSKHVMTESLESFAYSSLTSALNEGVRTKIMIKREVDEKGSEGYDDEEEGGSDERKDGGNNRNNETINATLSNNYTNNKSRQATGLISSEIITEIRDSGKTTIFHTKQIFGTSIGNLYAHYAKTLSLNTIINVEVFAPDDGNGKIIPTSVATKEYTDDPVTESSYSQVLQAEESILEGSKNDVTLSLHPSNSTHFAAASITTSINASVKETSSIDQALNSSLEVTGAKLSLNPFFSSSFSSSSLSQVSLHSSSTSSTASIHFPSPLRERKVLMTDNKLSPSTVSITTITVTATVVQSTVLPNNTVEEEENQSKSMNHGSHTPISSANNSLRDDNDDNSEKEVERRKSEEVDDFEDEYEEYEDDEDEIERREEGREGTVRRNRFSSAARIDDRDSSSKYNRNRLPSSSIQTVSISPGGSVPLTSRQINSPSKPPPSPPSPSPSLRARRAGGFGMRKSALSGHGPPSLASNNDDGRGIRHDVTAEDDVWSNWERQVLSGIGAVDDQVPARQSHGASGINDNQDDSMAKRITGSPSRWRVGRDEDGGDPSNASPVRSSSRGAVPVLRSGERSRGHHYYEHDDERRKMEGENSSALQRRGGKKKQVENQPPPQESRSSTNLNRLLIHSVPSSFTNSNPVTPDDDHEDDTTSSGSVSSAAAVTGDPGSRSRSRTGIRASSHENIGLGPSRREANTRSSSSRSNTSMRRGRPMSEYPPEVIAAFFGGLTTQQPRNRDNDDDHGTTTLSAPPATSSIHAHRQSRLKYVPRPSSHESGSDRKMYRNSERNLDEGDGIEIRGGGRRRSTVSLSASSFEEEHENREGNNEPFYSEIETDNQSERGRRRNTSSGRRRRRKKARKSSVVEGGDTVVPVTVTRTIILEPNTRSVTSDHGIAGDGRVSPELAGKPQSLLQIPQQLTNFHHHQQQGAAHHRLIHLPPSVVQPSFPSFETVNSQPLVHDFSHHELHRSPAEKVGGPFKFEPTPSIVKLPKKAITVTSMISVTKTLPIKHGFKTSFATITTPTLSTSIIQPNQFDYYINPSDTNSLLTIVSMSTIFSPGSGSIGSEKDEGTREGRIETVLVTTTAFDEIKLIPIRVGFSTRTDTLTSRVVMTKLTTLYNSFVQQVSSSPGNNEKEEGENKSVLKGGGILSNSPAQTVAHDSHPHQGSSPASILYKWIPSPKQESLALKTESNHGLQTTLTSSLTMNEVTKTSSKSSIQVTDSATAAAVVWMQPNQRPLPPSLQHKFLQSNSHAQHYNSLSQSFSPSSPSSSSSILLLSTATPSVEKSNKEGNNDHQLKGMNTINFLTTLVTIKFTGNEGVVTDLVTPITLSIQGAPTQSISSHFPPSTSQPSLQARNLNKRDVSFDSIPTHPSINNEYDCQGDSSDDCHDSQFSIPYKSNNLNNHEELNPTTKTVKEWKKADFKSTIRDSKSGGKEWTSSTGESGAVVSSLIGEGEEDNKYSTSGLMSFQKRKLQGLTEDVIEGRSFSSLESNLNNNGRSFNFNLRPQTQNSNNNHGHQGPHTSGPENFFRDMNNRAVSLQSFQGSDGRDHGPRIIEVPAEFDTIINSGSGSNGGFGSRPGMISSIPPSSSSFQRIKLNHPFAPRLPSQGPPPPPNQIPGPQIVTGGFSPIAPNDNSPAIRFHRVVSGVKPPLDQMNLKPVSSSSGGSSFRRVPLFSNQLSPNPPPPSALQPVPPQNLSPNQPNIVLLNEPSLNQPHHHHDQPDNHPRPQPIPVNRPADTPIPVEIVPTTRPATSESSRPFRRVRPGSQNTPSGATIRRVRPAGGQRVRDRHPTEDDPSTPSNSSPSSEVPTTTPSTTTTRIEVVTDPTTVEAEEVTTPESRRIVRIRKPPPAGSVGTSGRRRVVVRPASNPSRRPNLSDDEPGVRGNALDVETDPLTVPGFGSRLKDEKNNNFVGISSSQPAATNPSIRSRIVTTRRRQPSSSQVPVEASKASALVQPLTYFTTYTYLTTVLRGPHTLITSRVSSTSSLSSLTLDASAFGFLKDSSGLIAPTKTVNVGTKTKGPTTTIVNVHSNIHATHSDLPQILASAFPITPSKELVRSSPVVRERPVLSTRKPVIEGPLRSSGRELNRIKFNQLDSIPKTYFTQYTYFYTIIDGSNTKKSTRLETVSSKINDPVDLSNLKIHSTVNDGFVSLGSGPETVHLGRRSFGRSTTEVNLAMETYLKLDGITNAVIESIPTMVPDHTHHPTTPLPDNHDTLRPSFSSEPTTGQPKISTTPELKPAIISSEEATPSSIRSRRPGVRVSTVAQAGGRNDLLRSRVVVSGRPARIRVRSSTKVAPSVPLTPSFSVEEAPATSAHFPELSSSSSVPVASAIQPTPTLESSLPTSAFEFDPSRVDELFPPSPDVNPSRKRVAVTLTRRPFGGLNRLRTRTRPGATSVVSNDQVSTSSSSPSDSSDIPVSRVVLTRSGSASRVSSGINRFRVTSRVVRPAIQSSSILTSSILDEVVGSSDVTAEEEKRKVKPSATESQIVNQDGQTVSISLTTIPVVSGLDTSYRTFTISSTLTPSQLVTPSITPFNSLSPSDTSITPSAVNSLSKSPEASKSATSSEQNEGVENELSPSRVVITYYTTTTHTIPFTVGDQTLFTTFEMTNSRIATETLPLNSNLETKLGSDGYTLIPSSTPPTSPAADSEVVKPTPGQLMETRTMYTTFTFFTTFYTDDTSSIKSSEQVVSNVVTIPVTTTAPDVIIPLTSSSIIEPTSVYPFNSVSYISTFNQPSLNWHGDSSSPSSSSPSSTSPFAKLQVEENAPIVVVETSEKVEVSTILSTETFFATLFNGSTSTITPIEETKTEVLTLREPIRITRTLSPEEASQIPSSTVTKTYYTTYTNLVTRSDPENNEKLITSSIEEVVPTVVTLTVPGYSAIQPSISASDHHESSLSPSITPIIVESPSVIMESEYIPSQVFTTRLTSTTLTHLITLFSGSETILSSIEEISPTVVTEAIAPTTGRVFNGARGQYQSGGAGQGERNHHHHHDHDQADGSFRDLMTSFSPSISTLFTTHTYFTTLFSGTSSVVSSRADVTSSLVTLYVPHSSPSHPFPSSAYHPQQEQPSFTKSINDVTLSGDFILSSSGHENIRPSLVSLSIQEGSKLNEKDSSLVSSLVNDLKTKGLSDQDISSAIFSPGPGKSTSVIDGSTLVFFTDFIVPSSTKNVPQVEVTRGAQEGNSGEKEGNNKPGTVIDLEDILSGSGSHNFNENLGAAIKDIVSLIAAGQGGKAGNGTSDRVTGDGPRGETPQPVYIPVETEKSLNVEIREGSKKTTMKAESESTPGPVHHILEPSINSDGPLTTTTTTSSSSIGGGGEDVTDPNFSFPDESLKKSTPSLSSTQLRSSFQPESNSRAVFSQVGSGATTIFFGDNNGPDVAHNRGPSVTFRSQGGSGGAVQPTRYVTSVESMTRTLTLTTTKVYYTRDSPLTITSVLTTVIPPKTFVSTIIGSRTILGTATEPTRTITGVAAPIEEGEGSTTVTTTTLIFNSITTTVVRTLVIPTTGIAPTKPVGRVPVTRAPNTSVTNGPRSVTRKPLVSVRTTAKTTPPSITVKPKDRDRKRQPLPKPSPPPEVPVTSSGSSSRVKSGSKKDGNGNSSLAEKGIPAKVTPLNPVLEDDQCTPACNSAAKEICRESITDPGKFKCDCRPGFGRKDSSAPCKEMNNYVLLVRVMKVGDSDVSFNKDLSNTNSEGFKKLAKATSDEVNKAYSLTVPEIRSNYLGVDVTSIGRTYDEDDGVLVNLTLKLMSDDKLNEDFLREELVKTLEESSEGGESLPRPNALITAEVEDVMDFDECSDPNYNDCHSAARCINEPGSYTCKCKGVFTDLSPDPSLPGRSCAAELKSCDLCNGRGDCYRDEMGDVTTCKCQRMFLGRFCEINGMLLAILLPVAAILSIVSVCCIVYCCRKYKKRTNISKGFRNITQFGQHNQIGAGTLDRKAMLETSSDNSDNYHRNGLNPNNTSSVSHLNGGHPHNNHHHLNNGYPPLDGSEHTSMDPDSNGSTPRRRRDRSTESMDRSLGPSQFSTTGIPPQVVIPRARHPNQPDMGSYPPPVVAAAACESRNKCRPNSRQSKSSERRPEFIAPPPPNCPPPPLAAASGQVYKEVYSGHSLPPPAAIASRYKKRQPTASIISNGHHQSNGHHVPNGHSRHQNGYQDSEDLMDWSQSEAQFSRPPSGVYPSAGVPSSSGNSNKKKISPSLSTPIKSEFNNRHGWEWQMGHPQPQRSSSAHHLHHQRPFSPSASYVPPDLRSASRADMEQFRSAMSEAGRSCNETILYPATKAYTRYGGGGRSEYHDSRSHSKKSVGRSSHSSERRPQQHHQESQGVCYKQPIERAESVVSYTTSIVTTPNRYQFAEDRVSLASTSRRSFYSSANTNMPSSASQWGTFNFRED